MYLSRADGINSYIDVDKIVGPFSLVVGLQDRWQPMREDQLALRTNDRWLPEEKRPRTNEKLLTIFLHQLCYLRVCRFKLSSCSIAQHVALLRRQPTS